MRILISLIVPIASATDPCRDLCAFDGSVICSEGSWSETVSPTEETVCHNYFYRGNPEKKYYCYHNAAAPHWCPNTGVPVKASEATDLLENRRAAYAAVGSNGPASAFADNTAGDDFISQHIAFLLPEARAEAEESLRRALHEIGKSLVKDAENQ